MEQRRMNKYVRYLLWVFGGLLVLLIILYIAAGIYVSSHKKEITEKASVEVSKLLSGDVSIGEITVSPFKTFPFLSIRIKQISIRDSLYAKHKHALFEAENIYARVNPFKLIVAKLDITKIQVENGGFYLYTDSTGYSNKYLLQPKKKSTAPKKKSGKPDLFGRIEIKNFSVTIADEQKQKLFDFLINNLTAKTEHDGDDLVFALKESILVRSLAFKTPMGSYLRDKVLEGKYSVAINREKKELHFDSIPLTISGQPFKITGLFAFAAREFSIGAVTKAITVDFGKTFLIPKTAKAVSLVALTGPVDLVANIDGSLAGGNPKVLVQWDTRNNAINTPLLSFTNCAFRGYYTNEVLKDSPRLDPNSKIELSNFSGNWEGLTMKADKIVVNNLKTPTIEADLRSDFPLQELNNVLQSDALALTAGQGSLAFHYKGPIARISPENATLNGGIQIRNGNLSFSAQNANLSNCQASLRFVNNDLLIDSLGGKINGDPIRISGEAKNAMAILGSGGSDMSLAMRVDAPVLNLVHLSSLLSRKYPAKKAKTGGSNSLAKTARQLDNLLSGGNIAVDIRIGTLRYRKFEARNFQANIRADGDRWELKNTSLQHGNGSMQVNAAIKEMAGKRYALNTQLRMNNVDARKVWYEFEDFGMSAIRSQNIRGTLSSNVNLQMMLNNQGGFDMNSLSGEADFSIRNGELINLKGLAQIQDIIFKKRDFSDISFAEIKNNISFTKGIITINRMEINSSVLSFYVEGIYGFAPGAETDISIQVPVSNIKKRDKDYKPENQGANKGGGMSVFLRAKSNEDGTLSIKYDPLKKFRKSKTK
jgi:hypothetical protein